MRSILWAVAPLGIFLVSLILFPTLTIAIPVLVGMEVRTVRVCVCVVRVCVCVYLCACVHTCVYVSFVHVCMCVFSVFCTQLNVVGTAGSVLHRECPFRVVSLYCCVVQHCCYTYPTATVALPSMLMVDVLVPLQIYHRNFKTKWRKILACILGVTVSSLASPFLGLLCSFLIVPLGLTYIYGIIPMHILWTSSFGMKMRVRLRNIFRRRTVPTQDDSNA